MFFYGDGSLALPPNWRTATYQLSMAAYVVYLQLPFISGCYFLHLKFEDMMCHVTVTKEQHNICGQTKRICISECCVPHSEVDSPGK
jgi:hypothetical protein